MMNVDWNHLPRGKAQIRTSAGDFPQIDDAVVPERALAHLQESGIFETTPSSCRVLNVWYMPNKSLYVVYEIAFARASTAILTVRFVRDDEADQARRQSAGAFLELRAWNAIAWLFPSDPRREEFALLTDFAAAGALLANAPASQTITALARWQLLSYLPGERCALGYGGADGPLTVVGKAQKHAVETHRQLSKLWRNPDRGFDMAEPLAANGALGARWERFVPGTRIDKIDDASLLQESVKRAMEGLANLHRLQIDDLPMRGMGDVHRRVTTKVACRVRSALPGLGLEADAFCQKLTDAMHQQPSRKIATLHGDFHTANILFDGTRPCFIDLDELAQGDPAYDIALFATRLLLTGLQMPNRMVAFASLAEAMPQIYRSTGGERIPEHVYAWYVAALLVGRQVKTCIRHYAPRLEETSRVLMDWANKTLDHGAFDAGFITQSSRHDGG